LRDFLSGKKQLFKIKQVKFVKKIWSFKEMTIQKILDSFPELSTAKLYLPELKNIQKLDKLYTCNVG